MRIARFSTLLILLLLGAGRATAQPDITGIWEGDLGNDQFLQLNILQVGNRFCGYTYDHVVADKRSYCKQNFIGRYDAKNSEWVLTGTSFIEMGGSHILMNIRLAMDYERGKPVLKGYEGYRSSIFGLQSSNSEIYLKKVTNKPNTDVPQMRDCLFEKQQMEKPKVTVTDTTVRVKTPAVTVTVPRSKDSVGLKDRGVVIVNPKDSASITKEKTDRTDKEVTKVVFDEKTITLNVYDNALEDGDTVSIFYDGRLLVSHQRLSVKPIVIEITLDESSAEHKLVMFAENLGSIPPNTALIVATAGNKRYELFASASLKENAVLIFQYKPRE